MRFHFTIRDLLWLTLVAALVAGWWVDRNRLKDALGGYKIHTDSDGQVILQGDAWGEIWRRDGGEWKKNNGGGFGDGVSK